MRNFFSRISTFRIVWTYVKCSIDVSNRRYRVNETHIYVLFVLFLPSQSGSSDDDDDFAFEESFAQDEQSKHDEGKHVS